MESTLRDSFLTVEKYVMPLISGNPSVLTKVENKVLALQNVNRLNQRIGYLARQGPKDPRALRLLQTYVNNLTISLKTDNVQLMKNAIASVRSLVSTIEKLNPSKNG